MTAPVSVALAMPAYNEADGIPEFLRELDESFATWHGDVTFVVVDDCSTDGTSEVVVALGATLRAAVVCVRMPRNSGHGPTAVRAYREALATGAEVVVQVDGDGQFSGRDVRRTADDLRNSGAGAVMAKRRDRTDPWFRKVLTRALRIYLERRVDLEVLDPNCPLRAYRREVLERLLTEVPDDAAVPNVYLAVLATRADFETVELVVEHLTRRGDAEQGTMWGRRQRKLLVPKRLMVFSWHALQECRSFLASPARADVSKSPVGR